MKKELTFESAMARMEEIVGILENGEAALDDSMKLFEEAVRLADYCSLKLSKAEQKIKDITAGKTEKEVLSDEP